MAGGPDEVTIVKVIALPFQQPDAVGSNLGRVLRLGHAGVVFIFGIALAPVAGAFLSPPAQLAVILFLLFGFNLSRGISSAAWLPWIRAEATQSPNSPFS